jgi:hypothetical protein
VAEINRIGWPTCRGIRTEVSRLNASEYRELHQTPSIALLPLPASAQFLNVIESIFSGMARAIIHNSDYASTEDCRIAIDRTLLNVMNFSKQIQNVLVIKYGGKNGYHLSSVQAIIVKTPCIDEEINLEIA